jgi:integrase
VPAAPELVPLLDSVLARRGLSFDYIWPERIRNKSAAYKAFVSASVAAGLHDEGKAAILTHRDALQAWSKKHRAAHATWVKQGEKGKEPPRAPKEPDPLPVEAKFSPHSLRHSFAVACARAGLSLVEIAGLLGHSSTVPTARYAKFMPHDQHRRDQVARISATYAQKMPVVKMVSPLAPQTAPPVRFMKPRTGPPKARTRMSST